MIELLGATRAQQDRPNEDAFSVGRVGAEYAAIAESSGIPQGGAKKVLALLDKLVIQVPDWPNIVRILDSSLVKGSVSTLVAVRFVGMHYEGTCVGASRALLFTRDCELKILTNINRPLLGSGQARHESLCGELHLGDLLLLVSSGVFLNAYSLKEIMVAAIKKPTLELSSAILNAAAGTEGLKDDGTVVVCRAR